VPLPLNVGAPALTAAVKAYRPFFVWAIRAFPRLQVAVAAHVRFWVSYAAFAACRYGLGVLDATVPRTFEHERQTVMVNDFCANIPMVKD